VFSVSLVSGSIARQVLHGASCDACKTRLTSEMLLRTSVFVYFNEYSDAEQSLTYPSEKLALTVGAAVTLMESMMAEVADLNSVEQHITAALINCRLALYSLCTLRGRWYYCSEHSCPNRE
jgi:hypothetical protein